MPRAIADSDDDSDGIDDIGDDVKTLQTEAAGPGSDAINEEGAVEAYDGTNEKSTGSTECLRRKILSAERGLLTDSTSMANSGNAVQYSSGSPSMQATKRRHTAAFGSEPATSPDKKVKRTKTVKTYGSKGQSTTQVSDDATFARLRDDDAAAPKTSQSVRFSEHSGFHSSAELPTPSIRADFANHEPTVMFKDSGSTVEDTSSAQQRLLEQALGSKKGFSTSLTNAVETGDKPESSLAWWSASGQTPAAKSLGGANGLEGGDGGSEDEGGGGGAEADRDDGGAEADRNDGRAQTDGATAKPDLPNSADQIEISGEDRGVAAQVMHQNPMVEARSHKHPSAANTTHDLPAKPLSSPAVEIEVHADKANTSPKASETPQKPARGRKRKAQENHNTDPLNSDDKAIGLPKERYQPRPSRRRATAIVEDQIDVSVRPEKAAKVKRTKTTQAGSGTGSFAAETGGHAITSADLATGHSIDKPAAGTPKRDEEDAAVPEVKSAEPISAEQKGNTHASENDTKEIEVAPSKPVVAEPTSSTKTDDQIFVKPAKPTPKAKSASKAKRAQTTIFEDHVEFVGSQRSPSLRQQQAKRVSALSDVQNEAIAPPQKKRKTIVSDDEDDEDELAKELVGHSPKKAESPPKKRGRGRPSKPTATEQDQSAKAPSEDAEVNEDDDLPTKRGRGRPSKSTAEPDVGSAKQPLQDATLEEDDESGQHEPPSKRGRGRPAKTAASSESKETSEKQSKTTKPASNSDGLALDSDDVIGNADDFAVAMQKPVSSAKEMPTPSPEKAAEKAKSTPQKETKAGPTSHSPIKSSTKVPLRLGLNRRHRIPSLLKTIKPAKR
ncbi:hypothetical protein LTR37_008910 [Vermiconidia calcicola]|uniref:Uncharacterized protein n=1 Tax=Vermiconidia calcicola TaxID=1690605 RepID=A0ACC3N9C7_9PEZI|nr:hypothetical protein LTR37_008910 [Vermiconidia calcicola]